MPQTRSSSRARLNINYSETADDDAFEARIRANDSYNSNSSPPNNPTPRRSSRKRKQGPSTDSDDYVPNDYQPPAKRQKVYHHVDTPAPQRRSTRLALKQSMATPTNDENENNDNYEDEIENEEKDISQAASMQHTAIQPTRKSSRLAQKVVDDSQFPSKPLRRSARIQHHNDIDSNSNTNPNTNNGHTLHNGHNGHHNGHNGHNSYNGHNGHNQHNEIGNNAPIKLRRSTRNRNKNKQTRHVLDDDEDDDENNPKKRQDSDYGEKEFERDLVENEEEETDKGQLYTDGDDAYHEQDGDYDEHNGYNHTQRRRSARLQKKRSTQIMEIEPEDDYDEHDGNGASQNGDKSKSTSLPLSLRRPKRLRKPPKRRYEEMQQQEYIEQVERRQTLRTRKPVNYAESPDEDDDTSDDAAVSVTPSSRSSSRRSSTYSSPRRRNRSRRRSSNKGRGRGRNRRRGRRRSLTYDSSDDDRYYSSDSYSTDTMMNICEQKRIRRERNKIKPIQIHDLGLYHEGMAPNLSNKAKTKSTQADISPMEIDLNISWNMVGGLQHHVQKLKEMVVLPLLYPAEFAQFKMSTPKGVLFHGPPGTGKTLVARVLAAQCSMGTNPDGTPRKKVSFYMRKGADCLSKWVGEAERQLRLLFDEAKKNQPAVIFFDEIDGLAPVRSSRQDQIHSSIVSTLLALMDGLDQRGQIIVIGATNRPDAIDPALRRPGRFDRELCFNLPTRKARKDILKIHTKAWEQTNCKLDEQLLNYLSEQSVGYCGADLEALCREAFLAAVRRTYPQIYHSNVRLQIDTKKLQVIQEDFEKALKDITPSSQRSSLVYARALPDLLRPLLQRQLDNIKRDISAIFALRKEEYQDNDDDIAAIQDLSITSNDNNENDDNHNHNNNNNNKNHDQHNEKRKLCSQHYRYLIHGKDSRYGQSYLGTAVLHLMEEYPMYSLDLASIVGDSTTKCAEESVLRIFKEASRNTPSVIYWPHIDRWWDAANHMLKESISLLINDIPHDCPILIVATSNISMHELENDLSKIFDKYSFHDCDQQIDQQQRKQFWSQINDPINEKPRHKPKTIEQYPSLPIAELPQDSKDEDNNNKNKNVLLENGKTKSEKLIEQEKMACVQLRVYIRAICARLCKHFKNFIDKTTEDGVVQNKLSLFEIRQRNNERAVPTVIAFLNDIDELVFNVKQSAQTESLKARQFINEACHLQDQALAMMSQVNRELVKQCDKLFEQHKDNENNKSGGRRVSFADQVNIQQTEEQNSNSHNQRRSSLRNHNHNPKDKEEDDSADKEDNDNDNDNDIDIDIDINMDGEIDDNRKVNVNTTKINNIVNKLVKLTDNYVVEEMEEKMYGLLRIIYQYSNEWERNKMIDEINSHITTYFKPKTYLSINE